MKTLILAGFLLAGSVHGHDGNAASNSWLRNTDVCARGTMEQAMAFKVVPENRTGC